MNTINQNLPLFKNMQQAIVEDTSNYENIKPKQKMPLSRIDFQSSKFCKNNFNNFLIHRTLQKLFKK